MNAQAGTTTQGPDDTGVLNTLKWLDVLGVSEFIANYIAKMARDIGYCLSADVRILKG